MGRMADARKRARQAAAQSDATSADDTARRETASAEPHDHDAAAPEPAHPVVDGDTSAVVVSTVDEPRADPDETRDEAGLLAQPPEATLDLAATPTLPEPSAWSPQPSDAGGQSATPPGTGEDLVFPGDEALPSRPIKLPSSGLAADILSQVSEALPERDETPAAEGPLVGDDVAATAANEAAQAERAATRAHHFSFFAAPEKTKDVAEATEHLVTFLLGSEEYGVDVRAVQEIIRVPAITAVPRAPVFIRGVINLRGRIIPVIDLKEKLGLGDTDDALRRARVLVVRLRGRLIGLLVDGASQVLKVPVSAVEAAPDEVLEVDATFIRGVAKLDKRLIILIDLLEVLAPELRAAGAMP